MYADFIVIYSSGFLVSLIVGVNVNISITFRESRRTKLFKRNKESYYLLEFKEWISAIPCRLL